MKTKLLLSLLILFTAFSCGKQTDELEPDPTLKINEMQYGTQIIKLSDFGLNPEFDLSFNIRNNDFQYGFSLDLSADLEGKTIDITRPLNNSDSYYQIAFHVKEEKQASTRVGDGVVIGVSTLEDGWMFSEKLVSGTFTVTKNGDNEYTIIMYAI